MTKEEIKSVASEYADQYVERYRKVAENAFADGITGALEHTERERRVVELMFNIRHWEKVLDDEKAKCDEVYDIMESIKDMRKEIDALLKDIESDMEDDA